MTKRLLAIAGSDSSGGAGIQADIKTATALGAYAMTAITAVTAQDTMGVHAVQLMPPDLVAAQIRASLDDIGADAIKIGMLGSGEIASAVADALREHAREIPIVLDPVLVSTSGTSLLDEAGVRVLREKLIPLATLVTPNLAEAELLTGVGCDTSAGIKQAGEALIHLGAKAALLTGASGEIITGEQQMILTDSLITSNNKMIQFTHTQLDSTHTHGTGCTYSTAIAVGLARAKPLKSVILWAQRYVWVAIEKAPKLGRGHGPLNHMHGERNSDILDIEAETAE